MRLLWLVVRVKYPGVRKVFDKKKICWDKNPDYAVALGLRMYASMLNKNAKSPIEEVLSKEQTTMNLGVGLKTKVADEKQIVEIDVVLRGHDVLLYLHVHLVQIVEIDVVLHGHDVLYLSNFHFCWSYGTVV